MDEESFCVWLDRTEFSNGMQVQKWWSDLPIDEDGEAGAIKQCDDETNVEFFRRIREDLRAEMAAAKEDGVAVAGGLAVKGDMISLPKMVEWLEQRMGPGLGRADQGVSEEVIADEILHELVIAEWQKGGGA